jgi:hypothetical protein
MESLKQIEDQSLKFRLLNCFLYNRHFVLVKENRPTSWADPGSDKYSLKEK